MYFPISHHWRSKPPAALNCGKTEGQTWATSLLFDVKQSGKDGQTVRWTKPDWPYAVMDFNLSQQD